MSSSLPCPADFGFASPHHLRNQFLKINPSLCAHMRSLLVLCLWRTLRPEAPSRAGSENLLSLLLGPDSCVSVTSGPRGPGFHSVAAWTVLCCLRVQSGGPRVSAACGLIPHSWREIPSPSWKIVFLPSDDLFICQLSSLSCPCRSRPKWDLSGYRASLLGPPCRSPSPLQRSGLCSSNLPPINQRPGY